MTPCTRCGKEVIIEEAIRQERSFWSDIYTVAVLGDGCLPGEQMRQMKARLELPLSEPAQTPDFDDLLQSLHQDLLKRLDKLDRYTVNENDSWQGRPLMQHDYGNWVRFEQVKTIVGQWVADQGGK